jgi:hypothetical protein
MPAGDLRWFRHEGRSDGTAQWANGGTPKQVGTGWTGITHAFAADDGVIYAVGNAGDLRWFRHEGRSDGTAQWANGGTPKQVGTGWTGITHAFAADDGVIYAIVQ